MTGGGRGGLPIHLSFIHDRNEVNTSRNTCQIFKTDVTQVLYIEQMKNQSLLAYFTNSFIPPCGNQVSDADDLL